MRNLVLLVIVAALGWQGYQYFRLHSTSSGVANKPIGPVLPDHAGAPELSASFRCDGRTHCSQMTSCAEATFFLRNCPGVKMDGNNDGVPCEQQWCTK
ncbi:excalibur calcium-binding domain-containing protein [Plasticicumulans sp.]|uniref:excalibur calcium-binding domain-containing protein n=1 Tax=Plasticicumulans sp. TaxID=2307179 RepID=UPI002C51E830|nr:excalibur calcium-binding domain-containing protein [Pseudomonadota bacterium]MBS0602482.1 excalibur calcium-binding domain-containing protein [Pseudomonadota bacterium]HMZ10144.1 excalibur calcium-binding domain-containing protein [Plasticicumulans sp.]